ncbi:Methenyltetrahydrofolate cyclohydrolase [Aedoeadaptatus ivorii]|uniref:Methenyltetrahydrofolate cyclohydrolase n=1 Tax=Aedoeadaptatus ivorii TaxID=54006 RepID=A0A3S5F7Z8_9FIRM|nr:cyclodeaminase/cyclohydrolase family protein [Peptoniphilus ivorii]VEJ36378.1 Methenyltetrahydrofolate cyclohydrolase [Peptoniphilus ivorii]
MKLVDLPVRRYIEKAMDTSSLPGGGSVAALNAALAASLGIMILKLSRVDGPASGALAEIALDAEDNIDADGHAFDGVLAAFRLPKETESEKTLRREAIEKGYIRAIEVPISTMRAAEKILNLLNDCKAQITKNAVSDLYIAADLALTAFRSAGYTAKLNIDALKDDARRRSYEERVQTAAEQVQALHAAILVSAPLLDDTSQKQ